MSCVLNVVVLHTQSFTCAFRVVRHQASIRFTKAKTKTGRLKCSSYEQNCVIAPYKSFPGPFTFQIWCYAESLKFERKRVKKTCEALP